MKPIRESILLKCVGWQITTSEYDWLMFLFTGVRGREILRSPYLRSCMARTYGSGGWPISLPWSLLPSTIYGGSKVQKVLKTVKWKEA